MADRAKQRLNEKHEQILRREAMKPENSECFDCTQKVRKKITI